MDALQDEIRRLRRSDTNYQLIDIVRKIGTFDNNVNIPTQKQKVPKDAVPVQKYVKKNQAQKSSNIIKKKGRPVPIPVRNERPNYRKSIPRMRVIKKPESYPYYRHKSRKKRQFEETDFLTYWSDLFNFANLGPGAYFSDSTYSGGNGLNLLGTLAVTGTLGGAMMAGMPQPNFQVCLNYIP